MLIKDFKPQGFPNDVPFNSEVISVTKGFGALIIASSRNPQDMTEERISLYVEKATGNQYIAQDVLLKDFIGILTHQEDAIHYHNSFYHSMCELTEDGGYIDLSENETIKIQFSKIMANDTYIIYGFEEPVATKELLKIERKVMASETLTQDFNLKGYDVISLENLPALSEIQLNWDNGTTTTHLPIEMETFVRSLDATTITGKKFTNATGIIPICVSGYTERLIFPLKGIIGMKIKKETGVMLNMHLRIDESDWLMYQKHN